jgi:hypothetical protein
MKRCSKNSSPIPIKLEIKRLIDETEDQSHYQTEIIHNGSIYATSSQ